MTALLTDSIEARDVLKTLRLEHQSSAAPGTQLHCHSAIVDLLRNSVCCQRINLMFAVCTRLNDDRTRFGLMHIDQSDSYFIISQPINERRNIGWQSRTPLLRIEITQSNMQRRSKWHGDSAAR